jgi:DNA-directed RNA polymerase subunit RPC12/RpoP
MIYTCKNCGGNALYDPERKGMYCPFCDSEHSEEQIPQSGDMLICPQCGGELPAKEYTAALQCPYCDNYIILDQRIEGEYTPQLLIPFQYSQNMVKALMRSQFKRKIFAPTDFLSEVRLKTMEGEYVPFWLYDFDARCEYRGEGIKTRVWVTGDTEHTEKSYYDIYRNMEIPYRKIPADASLKMPDDIMDLMEPYDYGQLKDFRPEYLSGFWGERYNMGCEEKQPYARAKMEKSATVLLHQTIESYSGVRDITEDIFVTDEKSRYALLPVWVYRYEYKGKTFPFTINGQTGKIVGKVPVSPQKVWAYGATLWAVLSAILWIGYGLLRMLS